MLSRLVLQRVSSRAFGLNVVATASLRPVLVGRHHLARTFLTTAHVSEPVAKDSEGSKSKANAKSTTTKKTVIIKKAAAKKTTATKKAAGTTKAAAKKSKKTESENPEARFKGPLKSLKLKKEDKPPSKAPTAYSLYMRQQYITGSKVSTREEFLARSREVAASWNQLSDEDKKPYYEKEKEQREEYHKKLAEWFEKTDPRIVSAYNIQRKAVHKKRVFLPIDTRPRKPVSSFIKFTQDVLDQVELRTDLGHREALATRSKEIAEKWKALPESERERYKTQYKDAMEKYKLEHPKPEATA